MAALLAGLRPGPFFSAGAAAAVPPLLGGASPCAGGTSAWVANSGCVARRWAAGDALLLLLLPAGMCEARRGAPGDPPPSLSCTSGRSNSAKLSMAAAGCTRRVWARDDGAR